MQNQSTEANEIRHGQGGKPLAALHTSGSSKGGPDGEDGRFQAGPNKRAHKAKARKQIKYAMGRRQSHSRPCTQVAAAREGQRGRTGGSKQAQNKHAHKAKARKQKKIRHGQAEKPLRAPEGKAGGLN